MRLLRKEIKSDSLFSFSIGCFFTFLIYILLSYSPIFAAAVPAVGIILHYLLFKDLKQTILFSFVLLASVAVLFLIPPLIVLILHLGMLSLGLSLCYKNNLKNTLAELGFFDKILKNILIGVVLFFCLIILLIMLNLLIKNTSLADSEKVYGKLETLPLYLLPFAFILAPFSEEVLFRGYLSRRFGILVSSIIFSSVHLGYGSSAELIFTFIFGLFAGFIYQKTKSLIPSITVHILFNIYAILIFLIVKHFGLERLL